MVLSIKSILLFLFFAKCCYGQESEYVVSQTLQEMLEMYRKGNINFQLGQKLSARNLNGRGDHLYEVELVKVDGSDLCWGITIDKSEKLLLKCERSRPPKPGCFNVVTQSQEVRSQNKYRMSDSKVTMTCVYPEFGCVALTVNSWIINLDCEIQPIFRSIVSKIPPTGLPEDR